MWSLIITSGLYDREQSFLVISRGTKRCISVARDTDRSRCSSCCLCSNNTWPLKTRLEIPEKIVSVSTTPSLAVCAHTCCRPTLSVVGWLL